jgi:hypothetical protein
MSRRVFALEIGTSRQSLRLYEESGMLLSRLQPSTRAVIAHAFQKLGYRLKEDGALEALHPPAKGDL